MTSKEKIVEKYRDKVIGVRYNSDKLYIDYVIDKKSLISFLYEILSHEVDISNDGVEFLDQYWGLYNVANLILDYEEWDGDFHKNFDGSEEIIEWIKNFKNGRKYRSLTSDEKLEQNIQNALYKKYGGEKLGGVIANPDIEYYVSSFMDEEKVLDFLVDLSKDLTYLTITGYGFLNENYGFKYLASKAFEKYPQFIEMDAQKNLEWLVNGRHKFIRA